MEKDYIPIKEFASLAGVSTQAIYQRLTKSLQGYVKEVKGKKLLNIEALSLFLDTEEEDSLGKPLQGEDAVNTGKNTDDLDDLTNPLQELNSVQSEAVQALILQLEAKDKQISELLERLREAQELNRNNQVLIGMEKKNKPFGWLKRLFNRE